jgi:hypothetical protein
VVMVLHIVIICWSSSFLIRFHSATRFLHCCHAHLWLADVYTLLFL